MFSTSGAGAETLPLSEAPRKSYRYTAAMITQAFLMPWMLFMLMMGINGFYLRVYSQHWANFLDILAFGFVAFEALVFLMAWQKRKESGMREVSWMGFIVAASLIAFIVGITTGQSIFATYTRPYYDLTAMNVYANIAPSSVKGAAYADAGRITFTEGSKIATASSMGYKDRSGTYCVAPIVSEGQGSNFDMWAVGKDCCSTEGGDFSCSDPKFHSGLRLVDGNDDKYEEAVTSARKGKPEMLVVPTLNSTDVAHMNLYFEMVESAPDSISGLLNAGSTYFVYAMFTWIVWQVFSTVIVLGAIAKM